MRSVLLISSRPDLAGIVPALEDCGFTVTAAGPAVVASDEAALRFDAAIVDLRDLGQTQTSLLLEALGEAGLLAVVAVDREQIAEIPANGNVEDFFTWPATEAEIARRLERAIWRRHGVDSENHLSCGALSIDLTNYRVAVDGEPVVLTFKEYELLRFLSLNAGRVFTREQLLNRVWGYDYFGGARTVDVHIRRIRAKIEVHGHTFIETVRNVGYRLVAEARRQPGAE